MIEVVRSVAKTHDTLSYKLLFPSMIVTESMIVEKNHDILYLIMYNYSPKKCTASVILTAYINHLQIDIRYRLSLIIEK